MGFGVIRILFKRFAQKFLREIPAFFLQGQNAEVIEHALVAGIETKRNRIKRFCFGLGRLGQAQVAKGKVDFGIFRRVRVRHLQFLFRQRQVIGLQRLPAGIVSIKGPKSGIFLRKRNEESRGEKKAARDEGGMGMGMSGE